MKTSKSMISRLAAFVLAFTSMTTLATFAYAQSGGEAAAAAPAASEGAAAAPPFNPFGGVLLHKYKIDRDRGEIPLEKGRLLLEDLGKADPEVRASLTEAVRFEIQTEETQKFTRQKSYVLWAYGTIWVVLAGFVVMLMLRQRKLSAELEALEARVRVEKV